MWSYKNPKAPKKLTEITNRYGYKVVTLHINGKQYQKRINRLVAMAFIKNPNGLPQVNHIDGDKSNNNVSNLEWCTAIYNTNHAIKTGLRINSGEDFHSSKLSNKDVHKICKLLEENKLKACEIPAKIGSHCTIKMVHNILYTNVWKEISSQYNISNHTIDENHGASKFDKDTVRKICELLANTNYSYGEIAEMVGNCTKSDVNHIKNKYTWTSISKDYDFSHRVDTRNKRHKK